MGLGGADPPKLSEAVLGLTPPEAEAAAVKVAETASAELMVTVHNPVPAHAPAQPAKVEPDAGEAEIRTVVEVLPSG